MQCAMACCREKRWTGCRCSMSVVAVKNWSKPQHLSWSASTMPASTGTSCALRPLETHRGRERGGGDNEIITLIRFWLACTLTHSSCGDILWELAAMGQVVAPFNRSLLYPLYSSYCPRGFLCSYFEPIQQNTQVGLTDWFIFCLVGQDFCLLNLYNNKLSDEYFSYHQKNSPTYMVGLFLRGPPKGMKGRPPVAAW